MQIKQNMALTVGFLSSLIFVGLAKTVTAQEFPSKPIRIINPVTAGSTADVISRIFANALSKQIGQPIVVEPKPGANNLIALDFIARQASPDGYTIGVVGLDGVALLPLVSKDLRFDPLKDLTPVRGVAEATYVLAVTAKQSWNSVGELVDFAKANPGKLNYGSSALQVRFPALLLMQEFGLTMEHIPFSGGRQYSGAIISGTIDLGFVTDRTAIEGGDRVRVLGVTGLQRVNTFPKAPTFTELKLPQIKGPTYGMLIRTGTPKAIIDKLDVAAAAGLKSEEMRATMEKLGMRITNESADVVRKNLQALAQSYAVLAKSLDLSSAQ